MPGPGTMIRAALYALISIVAITFLRMVIGIITRGFTDLMKEEGAAATASKQQTRQQASVPLRGELKACQQCGTYVVASGAIKDVARGETAYFCSQECRQKFS